MQILNRDYYLLIKFIHRLTDTIRTGGVEIFMEKCCKEKLNIKLLVIRNFNLNHYKVINGKPTKMKYLLIVFCRTVSHFRYWC